MNSRFFRIALIFLVVTSVASVAQDTTSEYFVLSLHEAQGRFLVARYVEGDDDIPLFFPEDPTTSYFKLLLDNRIYVLGDSFSFRQSAETNESGGTITWTSSRVSIETQINIAHRSYVYIDVDITNTAENAQEVGLRLMLDTYLGEKADHFTTAAGPISTEIEFSEPPEYIQSGVRDETALYLLFDEYGATKPDRIVLANWKRLNDVNWTYEINSNRSFSYSPYSVNDSAVSTYFEPYELAPGESRSIRIVLAISLPGAPPPPTSAQTTTAGSAASQTASQSAGSVITIPQNIGPYITAIDAAIDLIDEILTAGREPTEEELRRIQSAIETIEEEQNSRSE